MDPMGIVVFYFFSRLLLDDVLKPFEFQLDYRFYLHLGNSLQGILEIITRFSILTRDSE